MTEQTGPIPGHPDYPWEPPLAGTELEHLVGMLDRLRWTFRWKASGLDAEGLDKRLGPSALTLGGLLQHLAAGEALRFTWDLDHSDPGEPWRSADWADDPDWTFSTAADKTPEELYRLYDDSVAAARERLAAIIAEGGIDRATTWGDPAQPASLRRLVCDLIEEYGRHTGHADLLRENVDGLVGEDPPAGWRP